MGPESGGVRSPIHRGGGSAESPRAVLVRSGSERARPFPNEVILIGSGHPMRLALGMLLLAACLGCEPESARVDSAPSFQLLRDGGGNTIDIGVDVGASREKIRRALVEAADELAGIPARDLIFGDRATIRAYLIRDGQESVKVCAWLSRYVPLPAGKPLWAKAFSYLRSLGTADRFHDSCEEARSGTFQSIRFDKQLDPTRRAGG